VPASLPFVFAGLRVLINDFAAHMLEVLHAIQQAANEGTIKIVSRIERPPTLSDNEAASYWRGAAA